MKSLIPDFEFDNLPASSKSNHSYQHFNDLLESDKFMTAMNISLHIAMRNMTYFENTATKPIYSEMGRYLSVHKYLKASVLYFISNNWIFLFCLCNFSIIMFRKQN